ncbi:MAG: hypothetical protein NC201_05515 [Prevotella sp.]|nr:hypothetical protein [Bacteroides sp.]MCM1366691.1 hypothetical protein [Prevotella sp.]
MKFRGLFTACLASAALLGFSQTHVEGIEYYNADQYNNARELLTRNMNNAGTDKALSNFYLGQISLLEKNNAKAKELFEAGIAANPECGYNYVGLGEILLSTDPKAAQQEFKLAEKYGKKDAALQVAIARAYYNVDPVTYEKEIAKRIEKAQKIDLHEPAVYIFEGDRSRDNRDWGNAAGQYEMAINFDPQTPAAYVKYANMYKLVNPQYTISKLQELLQQNPNSALGQRELANAYYQQENYKEAAASYGKYVNNPNHFKQDEDRYALLLFSDGDYQKGYDYATKLLQSDPNNFTAQRFQFMNAAQIKEMENQLLPMAEALYAKHKENPANQFASIDYNLVSEQLAKAKRPEEAIALLEEGTQVLPEYKSFIRDIALIYYDNNNTAEAYKRLEKYANEVKDLNYSDAYLIANVAFVYSFELAGDEKANMLANSAKFAQKAAELNPKSYRPQKRLGDIAGLQATGNITEAKAPYFIEAAKIIKENGVTPSTNDAADIYKTLGEYYNAKGDKVAAKEAYGEYLKVKPEDAAVKKVYNAL